MRQELFSVYFPMEQVIDVSPSRMKFRIRIPLYVFWWLEKRGYKTGSYSMVDMNEQYIKVEIFDLTKIAP